jgi:hypothetical protein
MNKQTRHASQITNARPRQPSACRRCRSWRGKKIHFNCLGHKDIPWSARYPFAEQHACRERCPTIFEPNDIHVTQNTKMAKLPIPYTHLQTQLPEVDCGCREAAAPAQRRHNHAQHSFAGSTCACPRPWRCSASHAAPAGVSRTRPGTAAPARDGHPARNAGSFGRGAARSWLLGAVAAAAIRLPVRLLAGAGSIGRR